MNFLELDKSEHISPKRYFDPAKSVLNTRLWTKREVNIAIIDQIEKLLPEFLYDFGANQ